MGDDSDTGLNQSWGSALLTGVSAVVDSQLANQFGVNTPVYQTQTGVAGQGVAAKPAISPALLIGLAVAGALLLILVLKK